MALSKLKHKADVVHLPQTQSKSVLVTGAFSMFSVLLYVFLFFCVFFPHDHSVTVANFDTGSVNTSLMICNLIWIEDVIGSLFIRTGPTSRPNKKICVCGV